jgi:hypothetical protein
MKSIETLTQEAIALLKNLIETLPFQVKKNTQRL